MIRSTIKNGVIIKITIISSIVANSRMSM